MYFCASILYLGIINLNYISFKLHRHIFCNFDVWFNFTFTIKKKKIVMNNNDSYAYIFL